MSAKRMMDLSLAIPGALFASPLLLAIAVTIKLDSPGPVLFRQQRVGLHGQLFTILKFRTMRPDAETLGPRLTANNDDRITEIGRWLRRYKLDELPQLLNVIGGSMSIVGPRPEVPEYVRHYPEGIRDCILGMRPGMTDYAALEFRNEEQLLAGEDNPEQYYLENILPRKLQLYERYARDSSILVDLKLILRTVQEVLR
jgi:lipopolysaccharide/colanic/teichoic acid biosynthesis glycosyltransferase